MNLFNTYEFPCTNLIVQAHLSFPNFLYSAIFPGQWEIHICTYLGPFQSSSPEGCVKTLWAYRAQGQWEMPPTGPAVEMLNSPIYPLCGWVSCCFCIVGHRSFGEVEILLLKTWLC